MKNKFTIITLNSEKFDQLPYNKAKQSLGITDTNKNTIFIRLTPNYEENKDTLHHEMEELVNGNPEHMGEDGVYYGLFDKIGKWAEKTFMPEKAKETLQNTPILGDIVSRGWLGPITQQLTQEGQEYSGQHPGLSNIGATLSMALPLLLLGAPALSQAGSAIGGGFGGLLSGGGGLLSNIIGGGGNLMGSLLGGGGSLLNTLLGGGGQQGQGGMGSLFGGGDGGGINQGLLTASLLGLLGGGAMSMLGGGEAREKAEEGISGAGAMIGQAGAMTPQEETAYGGALGLGGTLQEQLMAELQDPDKYYMSTLTPQLQLAEDYINRQAQQRGLLRSGLPIEQMGRAGVELAIKEANARMQNRANVLARSQQYATTQQQLGQSSLARQLQGAEQQAQYTAYPYQARLGDVYGRRAAGYALPGQALGALGLALGGGRTNIGMGGGGQSPAQPQQTGGFNLGNLISQALPLISNLGGYFGNLGQQQNIYSTQSPLRPLSFAERMGIYS